MATYSMWNGIKNLDKHWSLFDLISRQLQFINDCGLSLAKLTLLHLTIFAGLFHDL